MEKVKQKINQELQNRTIKELELKPVNITIDPNNLLSDAYDLMLRNHLTCLPVVEKELLGFVLLLDVICSNKSGLVNSIMKQSTSISPLDPIQLLFPIFTFDSFRITIIGDHYVSSLDLLRFITITDTYQELKQFKLKSCARLNLKLPLHEPKPLVTCESTTTVRQVIELLQKASSVVVGKGKYCNVISVSDLLYIPQEGYDKPIQEYIDAKKPVDGFCEDDATIGQGIEKMLNQNIHRIIFHDDIVTVSDILSLFVE
jgi:predicted transcriptional regulator